MNVRRVFYKKLFNVPVILSQNPFFFAHALRTSDTGSSTISKAWDATTTINQQINIQISIEYTIGVRRTKVVSAL